MASRTGSGVDCRVSLVEVVFIGVMEKGLILYSR